MHSHPDGFAKAAAEDGRDADLSGIESSGVAAVRVIGLLQH